jgi:Protein of unknown function (DUF3102)
MRHINQNTHQNNRFEYEALKTEQRNSIRQLTSEIKDSIHKTAAIVWQIGKNLVAVRRQIGNGQFNRWLKAEFDWSRRTAYNFINVYEAVPESMRAKFARMDISVSALYLLAAPSTPAEIRCDFFDRAMAGERISYRAVERAICAVDRNRDIERSDWGANPIDTSDLEMAIARPESDRNMSDGAIDIAAKVEAEEPSFISPAWNSIQREFSLFWGDTMSRRFHDRLPDNAFVLAIPSIQWHHDWLANDDRCCIAIPKSQLEYRSIERLLSALADADKALILPWIPCLKTIKLALDLDLQVYVGDPDLGRCEQIVINLGFDPQQVGRLRW